MNPMRVINLTVTRGDRTVLANLHFTVSEGDILHLRGPNGIGKTSLLEVLTGLRTPANGRIEGFPGASNLHWVGHRSGFHPALSPMENLRYWCLLQGEKNIQGEKNKSSKISDALRRVGLHAVRNRPCGRLSAGQRRRASLARLLAVERSLWILDEPLAALDVSFTQVLTGFMVEHAANGGAVIVSSHQPFTCDAVQVRSLDLM